jgi:hypothetical protein
MMCCKLACPYLIRLEHLSAYTPTKTATVIDSLRYMKPVCASVQFSQHVQLQASRLSARTAHQTYHMTKLT